ncbi:MAG: hypothetical protein PW788_12545 [Micavibrio sp.]|nr:hypothetical protein [Micavibrio sp.]
MKKMIRSSVCVAAILCGLLASNTPALAADQSAEIRELQAQVKMLQERLDKMAAAPAVAAPAYQANPSAYAANAGTPVGAPPAAGATNVAAAAPAAPTAPIFKIGSKLTLTPGGFIDTTGIYRTKNESADTVSNFNTAIPFPNAAASREGEFRGSARSTRLSLLAAGSPDDHTNLLAYVEGDFLAAGSTSNSVETNSYAPRVRQAYLGYERKDLGLNVYAGQMWNLATLYKAGLSPRSEALPITIDVGLLPGFTYARGPEVRVVKTFDENKISAGLGVSSPQLNVGGAALTGGGAVTVQNAGNAATYSGNMSLDVAPDITAKLAFDPGFGHYEVYGLARWFRDSEVVSQDTNDSMGGGIGAGAVVPVIAKKLDLQANVLAGKGVGRYGPALLPDVALKTNLELKPLETIMGSIGFIGHPIPLWDVYLFGGYEKVNRYDTGAATGFGYGDSNLSNSNCYVKGGACNAVTSSITALTGGVWHDLYKGDYGDLKVGAQNALIRRDSFADDNGTNPHAYEDISMVSLRYFPF